MISRHRLPVDSYCHNEWLRVTTILHGVHIHTHPYYSGHKQAPKHH